MADPTLYDRDFFAWANEQAALLRTGQVAEADIAHIAEEIESMGKTEKRELVSRLTILLTHLLKWQYQPDRRGKSWRGTIINQRRDVSDHLKDNPSLKAVLADAVKSAYDRAITATVAETDLDEANFPIGCPWSFEQLMNISFWPDSNAH